MSLNNKAMIAKLSISQWTARKNDRETTREVNQAKNAVNGGVFHKYLIEQAAIKTVGKVANSARTFHYTNTLPWTDDGARILPTANYFAYTQAITAFKSQFENAIDDFINAYPQLIKQAQANHGQLFDANDYPDAQDIRARFSFDTTIDPIPESTDFRLAIGDDELKRLQADIEARVNQAQAGAMQDLYSRLYEAVNHAAEKLSKPIGADGATFRDSLIGNLAELVDLLPRLNVTDDPKLNELTDKVKVKLATQNIETLRTAPIIRSIAAQDAKEILDIMKDYA